MNNLYNSWLEDHDFNTIDNKRGSKFFKLDNKNIYGSEWVYAKKPHFMIKIYDVYVKRGFLVQKPIVNNFIQVFYNIYAKGYYMGPKSHFENETVNIFLPDDKRKHTFYFEKDSRFKCILLEISRDYIKENFDFEIYKKGLKKKIHVENFPLKLMLKKVDAYDRKNDNHRLYKKSIDMSVDSIIRSVEKINTGKKEPIIKAKKYIDFNYKNPINLKILSEVSKIEDSKLKDEFKKITDFSITEYLQNRRMYEAEILLRTSSLSVNEIAHRVGYTSQSAFTQVFKRIFYQCPIEYRKTR
ncbi:MAG: AraC family transcriptional regulator [Tissierellia bacterium]|nr:AraC family transcriptional regulator [Tissierellia bacterium]